MIRYKMLGLDIDSNPIQYRTWVVNDTPDFTGSLYSGPKSGPHPLYNVTAYSIDDSMGKMDFHLPAAFSFSNKHNGGDRVRVKPNTLLPNQVSDSQLAIIGNSVFLFGGTNSDDILESTISNPSIWEKHSEFMPTKIGASQLVIVNGYIYLFGGNVGLLSSSITNNIYRARVSDPHTWTIVGTLPVALAHSQVAILNGHIFLFGGMTPNGLTDSIYQAPLSNPLSWSVASFSLPYAVAGASLAMLNDNVYLFGGITSLPLTATRDICYCSKNAIDTWEVATSALPVAVAFSQCITVGFFTYLLGGSSGKKILNAFSTTPLSWEVYEYDTLPIVATHSQCAIIGHRVYLFGGNGSSVIQASEQLVKFNKGDNEDYNFNAPQPQVYSQQISYVKSNPGSTDLFYRIGFAPWKTDFGSI